MKKFPEGDIGYFEGEDRICWVNCECEASADSFMVCDYPIIRCPKCGRGYKVEFVVWQFEPDETDEEVAE